MVISDENETGGCHYAEVSGLDTKKRQPKKSCCCPSCFSSYSWSVQCCVCPDCGSCSGCSCSTGRWPSARVLPVRWPFLRMVLRGVRCLPESVCSCCRSCCSALLERRSKCSFLCFRSGPSTVQIRFLPNNRAVSRCSRSFRCCICSVRFCCYSLRYMVLFVIAFADRGKKPSGHRRFF